MPIVQIDWQEIKSRLADDTALYALTLRQSAILLGLTEQLHWEKTFRAFDYDFVDYDTLQAEISDMEANLMSPVDITQLFAYIDEIEPLLRQIKNAPGCCPDSFDVTDGAQYTDYVEDGVGNVPQNIIDAGYASSTSDWAGFADYKCMIANIMVDSLKHTLLKFEPLFDQAGALAGGIATLIGVITGVWSGGSIPVVYGILASAGVTAALYEALSAFSSTQALADKVEANRSQLVCAIDAADGTEGAIVALKDKIDELFTLPEALVLKFLNVDSNLATLYGGRYDQQNIAQQLADQGYNTSSYTCLCYSSDHYLKYTFDTGGQGWFIDSPRWEYNGTYGNPPGCLRTTNQAFGYTSHVSPNRLMQDVGLTPNTGDKVRIIAVVLNARTSTNSILRTYVWKDTDTAVLNASHTGNGSTWQQLIYDSFTQGDLTIGTSGRAVGVHWQQGSWIEVDNVEIWFNVTQ